MDIQNLTIAERNLYLSGNIDQENISTINIEILKILQEDEEQENIQKKYKRKPIKLYINSFGGSVYDCLSLVDIMIFSKTPIYTYCTGYAMSAAFVLFICGTKRYMSHHATLMYHQISGTYSPKIADAEESVSECKRLEKAVNEIIINRTKITPLQLQENRKMKSDWYIDISEALDLGCADEEISSF